MMPAVRDAQVTISQPPASLTAGIIAQTNVNCFGLNDGSASVTVAGGTTNYSYLWNTAPPQSGSTANNLPAGTYVVTVTDAHGCRKTDQATITQPPASLTADISAQTNVSCFGLNNGSASVTIAGGTLNYSYLWNTAPPQSSSTANNLPAGTYVVTVTDAHGCTTTAQATITQPQ